MTKTVYLDYLRHINSLRRLHIITLHAVHSICQNKMAYIFKVISIQQQFTPSIICCVYLHHYTIRNEN